MAILKFPDSGLDSCSRQYSAFLSTSSETAKGPRKSAGTREAAAVAFAARQSRGREDNSPKGELISWDLTTCAKKEQAQSSESLEQRAQKKFRQRAQ